MSSGDQVKGLCDGGGGEGQESHDLRAPAGGGLQHSTGLPPPAEARRGLQSGSRSQLFTSGHEDVRVSVVMCDSLSEVGVC